MGNKRSLYSYMYVLIIVCNDDDKYILPFLKEEFKDIKGGIRIRISKTNRQHNGQKKKYKRTNNDLQNIKHTYKTIDRVTRTPLKTGGENMHSGRVNSSCSTSVNIVTFPCFFFLPVLCTDLCLQMTLYYLQQIHIENLHLFSYIGPS